MSQVKILVHAILCGLISILALAFAITSCLQETDFVLVTWVSYKFPLCEVRTSLILQTGVSYGLEYLQPPHADSSIC